MGKLYWHGRELTKAESKFIAEFIEANIKGTTEDFYLEPENIALAKSFGIIKE